MNRISRDWRSWIEEVDDRREIAMILSWHPPTHKCDWLHLKHVCYEYNDYRGALQPSMRRGITTQLKWRGYRRYPAVSAAKVKIRPRELHTPGYVHKPMGSAITYSFFYHSTSRHSGGSFKHTGQLTLRPCQGRLPRRKYMNIWPSASRSSRLLCSAQSQNTHTYLHNRVTSFPLLPPPSLTISPVTRWELTGSKSAFYFPWRVRYVSLSLIVTQNPDIWG